VLWDWAMGQVFFNIWFRWSVVVCGWLTVAGLVGCGRQPAGGPALGALGGTVLLSSPPDGNHAGITVYIPGTSFQARTAQDGSYVITGLGSGRYQVYAEHAQAKAQTVGFAQVDSQIHSPTNPSLLPTIILEPNPLTGPPAAASAAAYGSVRGSVFLEGLESSDGVRVRIEGTRFLTAAEADGSFRFPLVDPGDYTLSFERRGYESTTETIRVEVGRETVVGEIPMLRDEPEASGLNSGFPGRSALQPTNTTAPLQRSFLSGNRSIVGQVEVVGSGGIRPADVEGITVAIENTDYVELPDQRGSFRFAQLPAGVYKVLASLAGAEPQSALVDLTQESTARVNFRFAPGTPSESDGQLTITGQVVTLTPEGDAIPVLGASVALSNTAVMGMTGDNGEFRLDRAPASALTILVTKEGFADLATALDAPASGEAMVDAGRLELKPKTDGPRVTGTNPVEGSGNVVVGETLPIQIRFSRPMDATTLLPAVRVFPDTDYRLYLGANQHPQADDSTLVIELDNRNDQRPIRFNAAYEVSIGTTATDREGRSLRSDFALNFRTGGFGVVGTTPADGSQDVNFGGGSSFFIQFNTRLRPESVREGTIQIRPRPDTTPQFLISEDPRTGWTTVKVTTRLAENREYAVSVSRGIRAANGQSLSPYRFSFRTARSRGR
jgi:hypothetical protein